MSRDEERLAFINATSSPTYVQHPLCGDITTGREAADPISAAISIPHVVYVTYLPYVVQCISYPFFSPLQIARRSP